MLDTALPAHSWHTASPEPSIWAGYGMFLIVFKELEFVARSLPRLERRTFSSLELAS